MTRFSAAPRSPRTRTPSRVPADSTNEFPPSVTQEFRNPRAFKGNAVDVIVWQTATARLLPRLLKGRHLGPVFLTGRRARVQLPPGDLDPASGRARLSYRRAAELFEQATAGCPGGPWTLHQLRHFLGAHSRRRGWRQHRHPARLLRPHLGGFTGPLRPRLPRSAWPLAAAARPGTTSTLTEPVPCGSGHVRESRADTRDREQHARLRRRPMGP
jgi:hypothetical protein